MSLATVRNRRIDYLAGHRDGRAVALAGLPCSFMRTLDGGAVFIDTTNDQPMKVSPDCLDYANGYREGYEQGATHAA